MKKSKIIAYSAMSTALSVIFLLIGAFFPTFDLSALFIASVVMMLPIAKKSVPCAILTWLATSLLTLLISAFRYQIVIPYAMFFGVHPLINYFIEQKKLNKVISIIIKDIWFVLTLLVIHFFTEIIAIDVESIRKYIIPILIVGGAIIFVAYDFIMNYFQKTVNNILNRLKL